MSVSAGARLRVLAVVAVAAAAVAMSTVASVDAVQRATPECREWQECRQLALEARARSEYETFHDLAWRAIQTGPPNDPALMYLLARAQSLSGRPRDALIMLERLAKRGVVTNASTEDDFRRTRALPGWRALEALVDRVTAGPAAPAAPATRPAATPPAVRSALRLEPRAVEEVARFATEAFIPGGLAYDAVSARFLFGDLSGRRLIVLGEGSDRPIDLVRAEAARFHDVTALEIDTKRGDMWVASTSPDGDAAAIHRLQLISGRPLAMFEWPPEPQTIRLTDLAIVANGTILVLDSAAPRVLGLRSGMTTMERVMPLSVADPVSIAAAGDERTAYVAHRDGIARLDLQQRTAASLTPPDGVGLRQFERIRWYRNALVGVQVLPDGERHIVHLALDRAGGRVTNATVIHAAIGPATGPTFAVVSGDDLYYIVAQGRDPAIATDAKEMNVLVQRIRLR